MDNNYTHILFILDNSASMSNLQGDAIDGFNEFLKKQKEVDGKCKLDTALFSAPSEYEYLHENADIDTIDNITEDTYTADGPSTALIDAIGKGINDLGNKLDSMDEDDKPSKVLVNIFTDGRENASKEFTGEEVKSMIDEQEDVYDWKFAFLASDLDSVNFAKDHLGIQNVAKTDQTSAGMKSMYSSVSANATSYRSRGKTVDVQDEYNKDLEKEEDENE